VQLRARETRARRLRQLLRVVEPVGLAGQLLVPRLQGGTVVKRKRTKLEASVKQTARALQKIVDGERVLSELPALEVRVARLEERLEGLAEIVYRALRMTPPRARSMTS
jgi:hypothetical protein